MIDTLKSKAPRPLVYAVIIFSLAISAGFTKIFDFDIWWHIKTGWIINKWHEIPKFDIFSYTAGGEPWINHEWLFQSLSALAFYNFGLSPFTIFQFISTIIIYAFIYSTVKLIVGSKSAALWAVLIVLLATADRIIARPYLLSLILTAMFCYSLHSFSAGRLRQLYWLPVITIFWINFHGGGIMAPMIVLCFALGETIQTFSERLDPTSPPAISRKKIKHLWFIFLLTTLACIVNPYGADSIVFPFLHVKMDTILMYTQEWLPAFDPRLDLIVSQIVFKVVLCVALISFIINRKQVRFSHFLLLAMAGMLVLKGKRFTPDFVVIVLPVAFFNLKNICSKIPVTKTAGHLHAWGNALCIFFISIFFIHSGIPATLQGGTAGESGFGTDARFAPVRMVQFLDKHEIHGKVFNEMGVGGFLILMRWPHDLVFIDGRTPIFGDDFFKQYLTSMWSSKSFEELDAEYNFDYLVFKADQLWELRFFHRYLWESKTWKLVYAGADGFVYLRNIPSNSEKIKKLAAKTNPLIEEMKRVREIPF